MSKYHISFQFCKQKIYFSRFQLYGIFHKLIPDSKVLQMLKSFHDIYLTFFHRTFSHFWSNLWKTSSRSNQRYLFNQENERTVRWSFLPNTDFSSSVSHRLKILLHWQISFWWFRKIFWGWIYFYQISDRSGRNDMADLFG